MADIQWETYSQYRNQLVSSLQSSYEHFDKAILTLSGGGLLLSIGFIEKVVPLDQASCRCLLVISWVFFCLSILCTLISFLFSQKALLRQIEYADKAFVERKEEYFTKTNPFSTCVSALNSSAAVCFVAAAGFIIIFVGSNVW